MNQRVCAEDIKNEYGKRVLCGEKLKPAQPCPRERLHLGKYKSGLCGIGACEGKNPRNVNGNALPTCVMWQTCACKCHEQFDQMYTMTETLRSAVDNSSYIPDKGDFVMPSYEEIAASRVSSNDGPVTAPHIVKSELPDAVPATIVRSFGPTATGRAARGELESQVKWACDVWMVEYGEQGARPCTPSWISEEIGKKYGIKNPSVGAIDAVFKRWVKIGFAETATKPTRFVRYTDDGIKLTLEGCKERHKRRTAAKL